MEVELSEEQQQLLEHAAAQQGITVEQFLQQATRDFLEQCLGKPAQPKTSPSKTFFIRPKPTCH